MRYWALLLLAATSLRSQSAREANRDYATVKDREEIVKRLENPVRLAKIKPAELVKALGVTPGSTVVDLGTGTGMLLESLSAAVGPEGRVIAEDVYQDFLDRARAKAGNLSNVSFVLGNGTDPRLVAGRADMVIIVDAYHHFEFPEKMLDAIAKGLRNNGRLAIVEYHKKRGAMETGDPDFAITHIRASSDQVTREVQAAGFKLLSLHDHAPGSQYIAMFEKLP